MGIRFYCPNGHKLNVKTFLAGKRGICPRCGSKFEIPLESVRAPGERMTPETANEELVSAVGAQRNTPPVATIVSGSAPIGGASPIRPATAVGTTPIGMQAAALPEVRPFAPTSPAPAHGFSPAGFPSGMAASLAGGPILAMRTSMPTAVASAADPIAEAPAAIWYVRPASGGQFGPAAGEIMRQWLAQRRVAADSMLWREGWTDWKKAVAVFPSLGPSPAATAAPVQGTAPASGFAVDDDWVEAIIDTKPTVGHHSHSFSPHSQSKGKSNTIVIISFFLILLCVLLAVVMVTVILRQGKDNDGASANETSERVTRLVEGTMRPLVPVVANI